MKILLEKKLAEALAREAAAGEQRTAPPIVAIKDPLTCPPTGPGLPVAIASPGVDAGGHRPIPMLAASCSTHRVASPGAAGPSRAVAPMPKPWRWPRPARRARRHGLCDASNLAPIAPARGPAAPAC